MFKYFVMSLFSYSHPPWSYAALIVVLAIAEAIGSKKAQNVVHMERQSIIAQLVFARALNKTKE
jgi:hypothetical protein